MDAKTLTNNLGGKWHRSYGSAPCPVCQPEHRKDQNALTLSDGRNGRLLAHCKKLDCAFLDILAAAGVQPGSYTPLNPADLARRTAEQAALGAKKASQAQAIWAEAQPINGSIAEEYLRSRGITCDLPDSLRFHPDCWHPAAKRFPAMVAHIEGGDSFAVHRTYLRVDGSGKADVEPAKAMLGAACGGHVRLSDAEGPLLVGEGIESTLAAISTLKATGAAWASLSTSGMARLTLPLVGGELLIAVDGEGAGRKAGKKLAARAVRSGWTVNIADPGDGMDFADLVEVQPCQ